MSYGEDSFYIVSLRSRRLCRCGGQETCPSRCGLCTFGALPVAAALAAVVAPDSDVARSVDVNVADLARLLKRPGVHVPENAYNDHVVDVARRRAWRLVGAALLTALVAVAREMM